MTRKKLFLALSKLRYDLADNAIDYYLLEIIINNRLRNMNDVDDLIKDFWFKTVD